MNKSKAYSRFFVNVSRLYQQKKVRVYTELVLSLLTVSFFLFAAIKPTAVTIAGLVKQIEDQKVINEKLQLKINDLTTARKEYLAIQPKLNLLDQALPADEQVTMLAKELEALARQAGVTINSLQFDKIDLVQVTPEVTDEPQKISFRLSLSGSYDQLRSFLQSLESLRRLISLQAFGFQTDKKEKEKISLSLNGVTYYFKPLAGHADSRL